MAFLHNFVLKVLTNYAFLLGRKYVFVISNARKKSLKKMRAIAFVTEEKCLSPLNPLSSLCTVVKKVFQKQQTIGYLHKRVVRSQRARGFAKGCCAESASVSQQATQICNNDNINNTQTTMRKPTVATADIILLLTPSYCFLS